MTEHFEKFSIKLSLFNSIKSQKNNKFIYISIFCRDIKKKKGQNNCFQSITFCKFQFEITIKFYPNVIPNFFIVGQRLNFVNLRNFPERDQGNYILNGPRTLINYINIYLFYIYKKRSRTKAQSHKTLVKKPPNNEKKNSVSLTVWICKIFFVFFNKLFLEHFCLGAFVLFP